MSSDSNLQLVSALETNILKIRFLLLDNEIKDISLI